MGAEHVQQDNLVLAEAYIIQNHSLHACWHLLSCACDIEYCAACRIEVASPGLIIHQHAIMCFVLYGARLGTDHINNHSY